MATSARGPLSRFSLLGARREPRSKILASPRKGLLFPGWLARVTACENRQGGYEARSC